MITQIWQVIIFGIHRTKLCKSLSSWYLIKFSLSSLRFRTVLIANNIKTMSKEISPTFSAGDLAKIKKFSRSKSIVSCSFLIFSLCCFQGTPETL